MTLDLTRRHPLWGLLSVAVLAVGLVLAGCDSNGNMDDDDDMDDSEPATTLVDAVSDNDNLSTLATALQATDRVSTLDDTSATFTVFAPANSAFEAYDVDFLTNNPNLLGSVLDYHVVQGAAVLSGDLEDGDTFTTVAGDDIEVSIDGDGNVFVEGAPVTQADVETDNGVAHVIGDVLLTNRTATERVQVTAATDTLNTALSATGRAETLNNTDATFTIFAPADAAFKPYDVEFLTNNTDLLGSVLDYHVVQGSAVTSDQLEDGDTFTTVAGDEIEVSIDGDGNVFVEGAPVTAADIEASNAAIHLLGDVLLTNRTAAERLQVTNATQQLYQAIDGAGLADAFGNADNTWTTFAPNNAAFENADLSGFSDEEVQQILQYHVLDGVTDSEALLQLLSENNGEVSVETLQGEDVMITQQEDGSIVFNGGEATLNLDRVDQRASNGIIHLIDGLLIPPSVTKSVSYELAAQSNDGAISDGVNGTVTFWEVSESQTAVTLELADGAPGVEVAHPAHIHANSASESGGIEIYLTPIDGSGGGGTSARLVNRPFEELATFNGYVNIHESVANLGTVVSQGNIGANAEGTLAAGLDLVDEMRSTTFPLEANANDGEVAPNGVPGEVTLIELTSDLTFAQVNLTPGGDGDTGAGVSHPAHMHNNSDGSIEYYLSPVDGSDTASRSGKLVAEPYDTLVGFDGYVNVHESIPNLQFIVSQGNVPAN